MFDLKRNLNPFGREPKLKTQELFKLEDISVHFGKVKALNNISLNIPRGDFLFVTGASGAGKTTLMNLLAGNLRANRGKVFQRVARRNDFLVEIFQDLKLVQEMSIEENLFLTFDRKIHKDKNNFYSEMMELVRYFGFGDKLTLKVAKANGGLKQQVAIVRALLTRPTILLADEPTCSMDRQNSSRVFDLLNYYNTKRGLTVIWASHNRNLVKEFNGKTVHLDQGKIVYSGYACFI